MQAILIQLEAKLLVASDRGWGDGLENCLQHIMMRDHQTKKEKVSEACFLRMIFRVYGAAALGGLLSVEVITQLRVAPNGQP